MGFIHNNKSVKCPKCGSGSAERVLSSVAKTDGDWAKSVPSPEEMTDCGCDSGECELLPAEKLIEKKDSGCSSGPIR